MYPTLVKHRTYLGFRCLLKKRVWNLYMPNLDLHLAIRDCLLSIPGTVIIPQGLLAISYRTLPNYDSPVKAIRFVCDSLQKNLDFFPVLRVFERLC